MAAITMLLFGLGSFALVLGYYAYIATLKVRAVEMILDKLDKLVVTEEEKVAVTKALEEIVKGN